MQRPQAGAKKCSLLPKTQPFYTAGQFSVYMALRHNKPKSTNQHTPRRGHDVDTWQSRSTSVTSLTSLVSLMSCVPPTPIPASHSPMVPFYLVQVTGQSHITRPSLYKASSIGNTDIPSNGRNA